jgi:hypothetical protein
MSSINDWDVPYDAALEPKFRTVCAIAPALAGHHLDTTLEALNRWGEKHCEGRFRMHVRADSTVEAYFSRTEDVERFDR